MSEQMNEGNGTAGRAEREVRPPVNEGTERADFEHWFSDGGKWPAAVERRGDEYMLAAAQTAWGTWQAARADLLAAAPVAIMDTRTELGLCAPTEADFPALYALQGRRVALVDLGEADKRPNA
jgi:hypothetical protein